MEDILEDHNRMNNLQNWLTFTYPISGALLFLVMWLFIGPVTKSASTHKIEIERVDGGKLYIAGDVVKDSSQEYSFESAAILLLANTDPKAIESLCPFYRQELSRYARNPGFILWTNKAEVVRCMPLQNTI